MDGSSKALMYLMVRLSDTISGFGLGLLKRVKWSEVPSFISAFMQRSVPPFLSAFATVT